MQIALHESLIAYLTALEVVTKLLQMSWEKGALTNPWLKIMSELYRGAEGLGPMTYSPLLQVGFLRT